jgi:hypothetical protein
MKQSVTKHVTIFLYVFNNLNVIEHHVVNDLLE